MTFYDNLKECDKALLRKIIDEIGDEIKKDRFEFKQNEVSYRVGSEFPTSIRLDMLMGGPKNDE